MILNINCKTGMQLFLADNSVDAIVCDPPYELTSGGKTGFMGKAWDGTGIAFDVEMWAEALRVLKPGGHLLAFSESRTYHRMACAIEDAGFDIRDQIMWLYGCLDEQTEVATADGVKPYHKTKVGDLVLCYDAEQGQYSYQPILEIVEYDYRDTAYRLVGDFGEQVVSRNHRCIVERNGVEVFERAETLQREACVPFLEDLPALQRALSRADQGTGVTEQNVQQGLRESDYRGGKFGADTAGTAQGQNGTLRSLQDASVETGRMVAEDRATDVQLALQREVARGRVGETCAQGAGRLDGCEPNVVHAENDGRGQSGLERGRDISHPQGALRESVDQVPTLPDTPANNGAERRVCDGASFTSGASNGARVDPHRGGAPHQPQCDGQPAAEPDAICDERSAQSVRAWGGHKTSMVRVVPFEYVGKVWCLRVPTGAFVAVRNGVAFPTGNSGFPKSLDVSKAIDKAAGAVREVVGQQTKARSTSGASALPTVGGETEYKTWDVTAPATDAARQWEGWGTALKPAHEPICVARKPLIGTVASNILAHGTGAINIDACRVGTNGEKTGGSGAAKKGTSALGDFAGNGGNETSALGRWPANLIHDGSDEVLAGFPDAKGAVSNGSRGSGLQGTSTFAIRDRPQMAGRGDTGSAARFFYCAKASTAERGAGNNHPTVKPIALMRYLVRLVTPPGGLVLDPFTGSGTTAVAAKLEGAQFMGFELSPEYAAIATARYEATNVDAAVNKGLLLPKFNQAQP